MLWELLRLQGAAGTTPLILGAVAAATLVAAAMALGGFSMLHLLVPLGVGAAAYVLAPKDKPITACYAFVILLAGAVVMAMTQTPVDRRLLIMLLGVVIATDIAGYFAGRLLGGPKFWPRVSPKKTWSGIIAGWIASAALVAAMGAGALWMLGAVFMSFASQMGDIAESAIKRRAGVKDASNLIPGHGGFMDRFDGLVGAALVLAVLYAF